MGGNIRRPDDTYGLIPVFRLYVSGATQRSIEAVLNLKHALDDLFEEGYGLRMTDFYQEPQKTTGAEVHVVPTLIGEYFAPVLWFTGGFPREEKIRLSSVAGTPNEVPDE